MTGTDFIALLPLLITGYASVILTLLVAFLRNHTLAYWFTLVSMAAAFASICIARRYAPIAVTPLLEVDDYSLYFDGVILVGALLVAMFSRDYLPSHERHNEAYYLLLLMAVLGMLTIASSAHLGSLFLGIETLSVSLYGLIGYTRKHKPSLEAAMKYLILAATSSAFLLFGIALVYFEYGTMNFRMIAPIWSSGMLSVMAYFGLALIAVGFGFKLAIVPFHMWSPDVYQGAPAPVTMLIASGSKGAVFALLLRMVAMSNLQDNRSIFLLLAVLAVATMSIGNLLALLQNNVKRLLAYSSIAQIGYLLIPLASGVTRGPSSIAFYLASYIATTILAFGVISIISSTRSSGDVENLADYRGLASRRPLLAALLSLSLLSLIGMPLTSGFFAKFYIFSAAAQAGLWWLLIVGVINSGMSAFYYLRVVFTMYAAGESETQLPNARPASAIALGISAAVVVILGIYPAPLFRLAEAIARAINF